MIRKYYHATPFENLFSIVENGIKANYGTVYLCDTPEDAAKFVAIRLVKDILVCEVELDDSLIEESFDHSYSFFKCRAYIYKGNIEANKILNFYNYQLPDGIEENL